MAIEPESRLKEVPWAALSGIAAEVVGAVAEVLSGSPAERVLDRLLRSHKGWSREERRVAAESLFGVGLWRRRLAWEWGRSGWAPSEAGRLLSALAGLGGASLPELGAAPPPNPASPDLAVRYSYPDWIAAQLREAFGDEATEVAAALNLPGPITLRANRLRTTRDELATRLEGEGVRTTAAQYAPDALQVEGRANLLGSASHQEGLFEVQDEGSQLLGELVAGKPGETILDACAGAGGKTLQLAAQLRNEGVVYAFDPDRERLRRLELRAARAGARCVRILWDGIPSDLLADRVLVDAPCSELGVLRRGPDLRWRLQPEVVPQMARLQREILSLASTHVRPGGRLVYATCTFTRTENEEVVTELLASHPELFVSGDELPAAFNRDGSFRTAPHRHGTDAFFAAVLKRR